MKYTAIRSEGGLIPYDLLEQIANEQVPGQKPADFGLPKDRRVSDEIQRVWSDAQDFWDVFRRRMASTSERDPYGTTETRERWLYPLLNDPRTFGYDLKLQSSAITLDGASFPISHLIGDSQDAPPVHIEGFNVDLDHRGPKLRTSPRAMIQEFLNRSERHLWGIATNGLRLLLLRDSARTARPTYLEFDLQTILEGNHFHEFALFYRLCHRSRLPRPGEDSTKCLLEQYYQLSIEQGGRVRDKLRDGVEEALKVLGTGFLRHPENQELREKIESGRLTPVEYHRQLLRLVYRLLFLMVAEERHLVVATGESAAADERHQRIYDDFYSVGRLRERAEGIVEQTAFGDLWIGLKQTFSLFSDARDTNPLGIPPLNGELFSYRAIPDLEGTQLHNHDLLKAIRRLSLFREEKVLHRVNYSALDVEELGSVYESLLDFQPLVEKEPEGPEFELHEGGERKTTGSYYTRPELVRELIQSALLPVIEDRLAEAEKQTKGKPEAEVKASKENAILNTAVCDPACGSGHFLLEAARRLGRELARIRTGQEEPSPEEFHLAVRDAISHCIYGVDLNPLAVDLCKLALWLEGHWIGKPLSFLDHRIKCGNSLIGVFDLAVLSAGIPDEAFTPVTGDDKKVASAFKKRNRNERAAPSLSQKRLDFEAVVEEHLREYVGLAQQLSDFAEDRPEDVKRKAGLYEESRANVHWFRDSQLANAWTGAFFVPLTIRNDPAVPTYETFLEFLSGRVHQPQFVPLTEALAGQLRFFHWFLEFPEVFANGGFDVVLGNPPWERIKLQEEEHWADDAYISHAANKAERTQRIEEYRSSNDPAKQARVARFDASKHSAEATSKFIRESGRFPLTAVGDINTYALFAEQAKELINQQGRAGIIVPTGVATDDTNKQFFGDLNHRQALVSLYDFENREAIFPGVHRSYKFSLLTISARPVSTTAFACFLTRTENLRDPARRFELLPDEFALFNPNTRTCPIFRTRGDADLTRKLYRRVPVFVLETPDKNPWRVQLLRVFDMNKREVIDQASTFEQLQGRGYQLDEKMRFCRGTEVYLPVMEAKMMYQYNHRFATYAGCSPDERRKGQPNELNANSWSDPHLVPTPRYWLPADAFPTTMRFLCELSWFIGYRNFTNATNERTMIATILPFTATDFPMRIMVSDVEPSKVILLLANLNAIPFDYVARQKIGGTDMSGFVLKQLPVLEPDSYRPEDGKFISPRALELVYTSWDLKPLADEIGFEGRPFPWKEDRRTQLRAELDAYYAHLYGLTRDELRYILDPKDVFGEDFPSETFRVLKEKEEKEYGEYRTRRLVLAAYDELAKSDRFAGEKRESAIEVPKGRSMVPVENSG